MSSSYVGVGRHCCSEVAADHFWRKRVDTEDKRVATANNVNPQTAVSTQAATLPHMRNNTLGIPCVPLVRDELRKKQGYQDVMAKKAVAHQITDKPNNVDPSALPHDYAERAKQAQKTAMRARLANLENELERETARSVKAASTLNNFVGIMENAKNS
ncbi:hypothetical protein NFJ02_15g21090 [Pycnococcus provasolii]